MKTIGPITLLVATTVAQNVTVPPICTGTYSTAISVVTTTIPYPYASVLGIIGSYKNLTWSGNPDNTVSLNGTDNTVGTARTYDIAGAHVIETILTYQSPPGGPYYENHNVALLTIPLPTGNVSAYFPTDATTVKQECSGKATSFNFTAVICTDNVAAAGPLVDMLHSNDANTVKLYLGGQNFTTCNAINATSTGGVPMATYTGAATQQQAKQIAGVAAAIGAGFALF